MDELSYQAPSVEKTETFYRRASWWVSHREGLRRMGIGLWIVVDAVLLLFTAFVFVDAFLLRYEDERGLIRSLLIDNPTALHETNRAQAARPLKIEGDPVVLSGAHDTFDIAVEVRNPNEHWWAEVTYGFRYQNQTTPLETIILLPGESQLLVSLGVEGGRPSGVTFLTDKVRWHRVNSHDIVDIEAWKQDRLSFEITNATFVNLGGDSGTPVGRSTFSITNQTAFSYWSVPLTVVLRRGSSLVGVTTTTVDQVEAGETRTVDLSWFQPLPTVDVVDVISRLNPFDASVVMPAMADRGIDTRTNFGL